MTSTGSVLGAEVIAASSEMRISSETKIEESVDNLGSSITSSG